MLRTGFTLQTARRAVEFHEEMIKPHRPASRLIARAGDIFIASPSEVRALEESGEEFAYVSTAFDPRGTLRVVTVPVNTLEPGQEPFRHFHTGRR